MQLTEIIILGGIKSKIESKVGGMFGKKDNQSGGDSGYGGDSGNNNY